MKGLVNGRGMGWLPDVPDHRDRVIKPAAIPLPGSVDLTSFCPPIFDQGAIGSCTANAIVAAMMMAKSAGNPDAPPQPMLSRLFIYYCERDMEGTPKEDSGAMIRDGFKVLASKGACLEETWPYDARILFTEPDKIAYNEAGSDKAVVYARVPQGLGDMRMVLASGSPFVFGFTVYESFESQAVAEKGIVPMPGPNEAVLGGHAVLAVGYDDARKVFIVRNSWGTDWGRDGYCVMPYEYLLNPDLSDDSWTISRNT